MSENRYIAGYDPYKEEALERLKRASGRSTRLIDKYIQEIFNNQGKEIQIIDHHNTRESNKWLHRKIMNRLFIEHSGIMERIKHTPTSITLI